MSISAAAEHATPSERSVDACEWPLAASTFSWTPDILRAERTPRQIVAGITDVIPVVEIEAGQCFRSFPVMAEAEVQLMRSALDTAGAQVSVVGLSLDDYLTPRTQRSEDDRLDFLVPQLRAASILGAGAVRLPLGQAGSALLDRLLPMLEEYELVLLEEIQGSQDPASPQYAEAIAEIASRDHPRLRVLLDTSMLMPALPVSYLSALEAAGIDHNTVHTVAENWLDPTIMSVVKRRLIDGAVPSSALPLYMTMIVRFGRQAIGDLETVLPLVGGVHLKFWDLTDDADQVTAPLRALGRALRHYDFTGTLCSEWGGHDWLAEQESADTMTRNHLQLAKNALAASSNAQMVEP